MTYQERLIYGVFKDLMAKGNPETRVAKYMHLNHMSPIQMERFLRKLNLSDYWSEKIKRVYYDMIEDPKNYQDEAQQLATWIS